jgi:hypothetical protein
VRYYRLTDAVATRGRWFLASPLSPAGEELDPRLFTNAEPADVAGPLRLPLRRRGRPLDFTLADFDMPVASERLATHVAQLAGGAVQCIPVTVEGATAPHAILNVTRAVHCLDETASDILWWTAEDDRPDRIGQYRMVDDPVLDAARLQGEPVFRVDGWRIMLLVHEDVRRALEGGRYTGLAFEEVPVSSGARSRE